MKILKITLLALLFSHYAQSQSNFWLLGVGFNVVDDDGRPMTNVFNLTNGWNALPIPSTFICEKYFNNMLSVEFNQSINSYSIGNLRDGDTLTKSVFFMSDDLSAKFHFNSLYNKLKWFDPYAIGGLGSTLRQKSVVPTGSFGFGANFWITSRFGINVQSCAKFSFSNSGTNYLQHSFGVRYKFYS